MSSTPTKSSASNSPSPSPFRVNYSEYVADITGSPKTARKSAATTGIGHHINPLHNPYPNSPNQSTQQATPMPQYGGGSEKCARCTKTVYAAERKVGAGRSFHTSCFSCHTCKRKLDSKALSEHKGEIYCKSCYTKQFGAHGLVSGVTMSTEQTPTRNDHFSRRASSGDELDDPVSVGQPTRTRTYSTDNALNDPYRPSQNNDRVQHYPRQNDASPGRNSPINRKPYGVNDVVDTKYQKPSTPTGFERPFGYEQNSSSNVKTYGVGNIVDTKYQTPSTLTGSERPFTSGQNSPSNVKTYGVGNIVDTKYQSPSTLTGSERPFTSGQNSSTNVKTYGVGNIVDTKYQTPSTPTGAERPLLPGQSSPSTRRSQGLNDLVDTKYQFPSTPAGFERPLLPGQSSPSTRRSQGLNDLVDTNYQRSASPAGFDQSGVPTTSTDRHRSTYIGEEDRSNYIHKGQQLSYGGGTTGSVDIPIVIESRRQNSTNDRGGVSTDFSRDNDRSRSPSPSITSNDPYRRQTSQERQVDMTGNYSRLNSNEDNNRRYSNNPMANIGSSGNSTSTQNYHRSSSSTAHETNYINAATSSSTPYSREQQRSREGSPSVTMNINRSPSPSGGYTSTTTARTSSSSTYRIGGGGSQDFSSGYVPRNDYLNTQTSTSSSNRNSTTSQPERKSFGLTDFVARTNVADNASSTGGNKFSALNALVTQQQSNDDFLD